MSHDHNFLKGIGVLAMAIALGACPGPEVIPDDLPPKDLVTRATPELPAVPAERVAASGVEEFEVDGLKVILKPTPGRPIVSIQLFIDGGVANLDEKTAGIEALALAVATHSGTQKTPRDDFNRKLNAMGSSIGASTNRDFSILSMGSVLPCFADTWRLFAEVLTAPAFDEKQLELDRERTIEGIKAEIEDPEQRMSKTASELFFAAHPYVLRTDGTVETVQSFTREQLTAYLKALMTRERLTLVVVGDLTRATIEGAVRADLAGLPAGQYQRRDLPPLDPGVADLSIAEQELPTNYMIGYFTAPAATHPDYYPLLVAINVLSDRLFEEVRTKRNLTYAVSSGLGARPYNYGYLYATPVDPTKTVEVMYAEIDRIQTEALTAKELSDQIEVFLTEHYMRQETNSAQVATLGAAELNGGGWEQSLVFIDRVKAVTPADVTRVSKDYIKNIHWGIVGNPAAVDKALLTSR